MRKLDKEILNEVEMAFIVREDFNFEIYKNRFGETGVKVGSEVVKDSFEQSFRVIVFDLDGKIICDNKKTRDKDYTIHHFIS